MDATGRVVIRDAGPADLPAVLDLNAAWEHVTSPLDESALADLHAQSTLHRVAEVDGAIAAFLLAIGPGCAYGSPNYRWFADRTDDFLYIDRVVVDAGAQRLGLGAALYRDAYACASERGAARVVCEIDVEPLNRPSDEFHRRQGFVEVGSQWVGDGAKRVSLRERLVDAVADASPARVSRQVQAAFVVTS